jgi:hypothetical protein
MTHLKSRPGESLYANFNGPFKWPLRWPFKKLVINKKATHPLPGFEKQSPSVNFDGLDVGRCLADTHPVNASRPHHWPPALKDRLFGLSGSRFSATQPTYALF